MHQDYRTTQQKTTLMRNQLAELGDFQDIISQGLIPGVHKIIANYLLVIPTEN